MQGLRNTSEGLTETLQSEAGKDSLQDRYHAGYIAAVKDILNIRVEELE